MRKPATSMRTPLRVPLWPMPTKPRTSARTPARFAARVFDRSSPMPTRAEYAEIQPKTTGWTVRPADRPR